MNTIMIPVLPKSTNAKTQFFEINPEHEEYIYYWIERFAAEMLELCTADEELRRDLFRRRPNTFPKGKLGPNSVMSFAGGLISNKKVNPNKNISEPQLEGIENLFRMISFHYSGEQEGVYRECLPVKFRRQFFQ